MIANIQKMKNKAKNNKLLTIEEISRHKESGIIGGNSTYLALKHSTTYMILTDEIGLKVIKNTKEVYSEKLPLAGGTADSALYISHLDCFLISQDAILYRKDINSKAPYIYMDLSDFDCDRARLKYSPKNRRLIGVMDSDMLTAINMDEKRVELQVEKSSNEVSCFEVFGENDHKLVTITEDACIQLHVFNFWMKKILSIFEQKINLIKERDEWGVSLAVCDRNEYILVEIQANIRYCSRMILFKVKGNILIKEAILDPYLEENRRKDALECCGYYGGKLLWIGLEYIGFERAQLFEYNTETHDLKELVEARVEHREIWPLEIHRFGKKFYYTGVEGKVMNIILNV